MPKILVIEDDQGIKDTISKGLSSEHVISMWPDGRDIFVACNNENYDVVILNIQIANKDGFGLLKWIRTNLPTTPVIVTSRVEKADIVVRVIKLGAHDFIPMPVSEEKFKLAVDQALEKDNLKKEIDYLRHEQDVIYDFDRLIAESPSMREVIESLRKFANTDSTILITGETGTGKSFLSGTIHFNSGRRGRPFIKINCTNIPETLLESELFGHEKGAFTGASKTRVGRFEQGNGGTVFLDEIGELTPSLQAKLLRVLEEKSFERLGGNRTINADVRIIAATNKNLEELIEEGTFRLDLFYRINVLRVHLPPIRERKECIDPLADFLLRKVCRSVRKNITGFSPEVIRMFRSYSWPGNIREFTNTIERAVILEDGPIIQAQNVHLTVPTARPEEPDKPEAPQDLETHEKDVILDALGKSSWFQKDAAALLGVSPRVLNYKIKKYGISHPRWRKHK